MSAAFTNSKPPSEMEEILRGVANILGGEGEKREWAFETLRKSGLLALLEAW